MNHVVLSHKEAKLVREMMQSIQSCSLSHNGLRAACNCWESLWAKMQGALEPVANGDSE